MLHPSSRRLGWLWIALGVLVATIGLALATMPRLAVQSGLRGDDATLGMEFLVGGFLVVIGAIFAGLGGLVLRGVAWARWGPWVLLGVLVDPRVVLAVIGIWLGSLAWHRRKARPPARGSRLN